MAKPKQVSPESDDSALMVQIRPLDTLAAYARNARTHDDAQVAQLMGSMIEWGFTNPILADADGIVAGHGRAMAARKLFEQGKQIKLPSGRLLPLGSVPVIDVSGWSEAKRRAYILADNQLATKAGWDYELLAVEMDELRDMDFNLDLIGFSADELAELIGNANSGEGDGLDESYTKKITIPVYEPKGEKPELSELTDAEKTKQLIANTMAADITDDEKAFLITAAQRHVVFNYELVAEYYCHANTEMQRLMESSALVLIDFDRAVAEGYVQMSKKLEGVYSENHGEDESDDEEQ